jgi:conjugative relaxase-like TrwC/TraI family protein
MLTVSSGHSADYLTGAVASGRENYYTGAVTAGEPPGRWYGRGAEALGLSGLVDHQDMTALYEHYIHPSDPGFRDPTRWDGADTLGHTGRRYLSETEIYAAALQAEPQATPERRAELMVEAGKRARKNVSFLDLTFSVQKSVTVLHTAFEAQEVQARRTAEQARADQLAALAAGDTAGAERYGYRYAQARTAEAAWAAHRTAVEDAIWAGNNAMLDYVQEHAGVSRVGHHGGAAGRYIDTAGLTVASFFQHTSRDNDPQLHIHNATLNRARGTDGVWRTLDSRGIHKVRPAAAAVAERVMEETLTRTLGVRFAMRPDGKAREVVGVREEATALFSSRRRAITPKVRALVAQFEARFGREPNALELTRLAQTANLATRQAKSHDGETDEQRLERCDAQLRAEVGSTLADVAHEALAARPDAVRADAWSEAAVIESALAAVQEKKAAWTAADLMREVSDALPDVLGIAPDQVPVLLERLTGKALTCAVSLEPELPGAPELPPELRRADGRSAYEAPGGRLYATPAHVHTERLLIAAANRGGAPALAPEAAAGLVAALAESGIELGADQAAAVRGILTSGAAVETLVGPAGTGKSFVVGALTKAWQDPALWEGVPRRVVGLATSQIATEVLAGEGLAAQNITRWLATQQRLATRNPARGDLPWRLSAGDLIVVDESAMTNTADLAAIHAHAAKAGAKLLLTGDHRQLAAVGAGGGMRAVADAAPSYELAEARRFTAAWERAASLRLRDGDESVLEEYHRRGRILDGGATEQAEATAARAWLADTADGRHALLIVDTNEQAARISADLRTGLVRLGLVEEAGVPLGLQGTYAGVGDLVQARMNAWELAGVEGNRRGPVNREQYRVIGTRDDGGLVVAPLLGRAPDGEVHGHPMTLPGDYVREHVALGYASTVHSAQGLTVDTSHAVVTPATPLASLYPALTRGREANTAHVVTRSVPTDAPTGTVADAVHRNPLSVLANAMEAAEPDRSALAVAVEAASHAGSVSTAAELLADAAELATAGRTCGWLDQLAAAGHLSAEQRIALAVEDGGTTLTRVLRRAELAGHDPHQVLVDAVTSRSLEGARQLANVLHKRITDSVTLDPIGDTFADWIPRLDNPAQHAYLATLAAAADARRVQLAAEVAIAPPQWAVEALGPVPEGAEERVEWEERAGIVAAHRELSDHDDPATALGAAPKPGQVEAYASWRAAWRALGRPEADRAEQEMSDGQLHARIRAYEREQTWGPRYVANELAGTSQAAARHRHTATLRAAEGAAADPEDRARLAAEAAEAAALADILDTRAAQLQEADDARASWLVHTAETRAAADRARTELSARRAADGREDEPATAEDWLAAQTEADLVEDQHRQITSDADLAEVAASRAADVRAVEAKPHTDAAETALPDIREVAAGEQQPAADAADQVRVPSAEETADRIEHARRALAEMEQRKAAEDRRAAEEARADQLTRWDADAAADQQRSADLTDDRGPVLELTTPLD